MKRLILVAAIALSVASASAQIFVGGAIGINSSSDDAGSINAPGVGYLSGTDYSQFGLQFTPKVGYILNDKLSVGVSLLFSTGSDELKNGTQKVEFSTTAFGLAPFVRYNAVTFGKFNLGLEAELGFASTSSKLKEAFEAKSSGTTFGLNVAPVVSYDISDRVSFETYLNFAALSFVSESTKPDGGEKTSSSDFNFGVDATNAFTTGAIQIGFVYKF